MIKDRIMCQEIYDLIAQLPQFDKPSAALPKNGLYFFFESGEYTKHSQLESNRIVRVGNHYAKDGLFVRLQKHYTGSKRNSVFLRLIGGAQIRQNNPTSKCLYPCPSLGHWEKQKGKYCSDCEPFKRKSKEYILSNTTFTVVSIPENELRSRLEKALVSTISLCPVCKPSKHWLGKFAYPKEVKDSGLWQCDYVFDTNLILNPKLLTEFHNSIALSLCHYESFR
jgi:hypothetical protein